MGVVLIYNIIRFLPYEAHYFEKLGVNRIRYLYSDMIKDFGEPIKIDIRPSQYALAVYEEFTMVYTCKADDAFLQSIRITGEKYRFGWRSIGVGSTRKEVEKAYKNVKKSTDPICAYVDGKIFVEFIFNENDVVTEIWFFDYSHY